MSTGGTGLATFGNSDNENHAAINNLVDKIASDALLPRTTAFWIGGAYFDPPGSPNIAASSSWSWFPLWNDTNIDEAAQPANGLDWRFSHPFPKNSSQFVRLSPLAKLGVRSPTSCMVSVYDNNTRVYVWKNRPCSYSNVSMFVRTPLPITSVFL